MVFYFIDFFLGGGVYKNSNLFCINVLFLKSIIPI